MVAHYLLALVLAASEPGCAGAVTQCEGPAELVRQGQRYRLVHGAAVQPGDQIICGQGARVAMFLTEGQTVMLAPGTRVGYDHLASMTVSDGEARITCDGWPQFEIRAGDESLLLGRGIVRVRAAAGRASWQLEHGKGTLVASDGRQQDLTADVELHAGDGKDRWTILPAAYQRAAVQQAAPQIEPPSDLRESPSDAPGASDRSSSVQAEDEDEEDRLPRTAPEPALPPAPEVDRGGAVDDGRRDLDAGSNVSSATFGSFASFSLGSFSGSGVSFGSGGLFADAAQNTLQGSLTRPFDGLDAGDPFPGNIHLVTADNQYLFNNVQLTSAERSALFPATDKYFSIGVGAPPTSQVFTDVATGTGPTPNTIPIGRFDNYLIQLDQYGIPDPAVDPAGAAASNFGVTGLLGTDPSSPTIVGATPLLDERAVFNEQATFALGEFRVTPIGTDGIAFSIRRSDQDRTIVKDPGLDDAQDLVTPNPDVAEFQDVADPRFQPAVPTVKVPVPGAYARNEPQFRDLNFLRRAAVTTLMADQLFDYSQRTGQTRFVVDGRIVDISGFQRQ